MSINKNYYVIAGYDLTGLTTDKYEDWQWDDGEKYVCYQSKGHIQLFDDPMSGEHLYFGYILASGDEYDFPTTKFNIDDVNNVKTAVEDELVHLINVGVIDRSALLNKYQIIIFEECT